MAGKFDHLMPVQVGDIVKEIRAIKKTLVRVGSTAQNAAALAHRAVPDMHTVQVDKNEAWTNPTTGSYRALVKTDIPEGATRAQLFVWVSAGCTFTTLNVDNLTVQPVVYTDADPGFWPGPVINSGNRTVAVAQSALVAVIDTDQLVGFVGVGAWAWHTGGAVDGVENVHLSALLNFYR